MNVKLLKEIKKISNNYKDDKDYLIIIKYIIFLVSKVFYYYKIQDFEKQNNIEYILSNELSMEDIFIFCQYDCFNINDNTIKNEINFILKKHNFSVNDINGFVPGILYESLLTKKEKNNLGQVYTPKDIINLMINNILNIKPINKNIKIFDPACGGGYFLIELFKQIRSKSINQLDCTQKEIEQYILNNMIYGNDVDKFSVFLSKLGLLFNSKCINTNINIYNEDILFTEDKASQNRKYDIIIGNPPYIGHKKINKDYRNKLKEKYSHVYYDKSDISYCFFQMAKEKLKDDGLVSFITSRYFMEAQYANRLREYIKSKYQIISIIDYNGKKVFSKANISPVVITLQNNKKDSKFSFNKYNHKTNGFISYNYNQKKLKENYWRILDKNEEKIFNKIDTLCNCKIRDICNIKQGIITGFDRAFILNYDEIETNKIEKRLIKRWIKNSNIRKKGINFEDKYIIYTNLIEDETLYPNTIKYLEKFKERLVKRRECETGTRKWYELQWGRELNYFEQEKIVFPYKSNTNKFFYDKDNYLCSADIYIIIDLINDVTYDYLNEYLNSVCFEYYFKCVGKKVGEKLYEYYPNKILDLGIYLPNKEEMKKVVNNENDYIDSMLFKVFNISKDERDIIKKYINN